jgi:DNA modification methylase
MDYQYQHEPILYGWKPGGPHRWYGGRNQASVWDFPKPMRNGVHPTMKPIALVEKAIQNSSQPGEIVFDGFGCSGSTMVAAHMQGRRARLIELDPKYCDVIVSRMRDLFPDLTITKNGDSVAA